jgi:hypothetical protein
MLHALPVPADVGTFTLSERTEVRGRDPDQVTGGAAMDLDLSVDARAALASLHHTYTLAYTPRLTFLDLNAVGLQPALLNGLEASAEWRARHVLVNVTEVASYGTRSMASLGTLNAPGTPVQTAPGGQPVPIANAQLQPTVETFLYASSNTTVSSVLTLKPWVVTASVGYQLSGGANSQAEAYLPFQQGPHGEATADVRASRHDHLVTDVSGLEATFSSPAGLPPIGSPAGTAGTGTQALLVQALEEWKHAWSRSTDSMLAAGVYEARTRDAAFDPDVYSTNALAEGSLEQRFGRGKNLGSIVIDFRLAPLVNQLTGLVDERVQGTLVGSWTRRKVSLRGTVTAAESTNQSTAAASKVLTGEIDASYAHSPALSFDVGARVITQDQNTATTLANNTQGPISQTSFGQAIVFVAMTFRAVKATF